MSMRQRTQYTTSIAGWVRQWVIIDQDSSITDGWERDGDSWVSLPVQGQTHQCQVEATNLAVRDGTHHQVTGLKPAVSQ